MADDTQGADDSVFVETVSPIGSAKRCVVLIDQFTMTTLHCGSVDRKGWMSVIEFANDFRGIDSALIVQGHAIRFFALKRLEHVHIVRDRRAVRIASGAKIIPTRPRSAIVGQRRIVRVQGRDVGLVRKRRQDLLLLLTGIVTKDF